MTSSAEATVSLRALEPEDLELLYAIENDPGVWEAGLSPTLYSRYMLKQYIATAANDIYVDGQLRLVVQLGDAAMGLADLTGFDAASGRAEVGMVVVPQYRCRGLGTAALVALAAHARRLHLHQLWATVAVGHVAAEAMVAHAGFSATAALRQWLRVGDGYRDARIWQLML
ncbi:MAG: GNAT family N-acetyltransferase [Bacteroidaceae bacterium]|nr:GNAT family N-acetyltransferase [Bacteroidaceae bacterium]